MTDRPSDGMTLEELREEFDWISEFQSRMAERIRGDADVHNLVDYVGKLESENTKLREERDTYRDLVGCMVHPDIPDQLIDENAKLCDELAKLRVLVLDMFSYAFNREMELCNACVEANGEFADCAACDEYDGACGIAKKRFEELYADRLRELEVIE